jgi:peptide/nickel transport system permease protein
MVGYALNRLGLALLIVLVAMAILVGMIHLVPGDPASIVLGPRATPELVAEFRARMGLDRALPVQLGLFMWHAMQGDLGRDLFTNLPVLTIVAAELPHTFALAALGLGWSVALGVPLGCFSAAYRNSWLDRIAGVAAVSAIAIPSFVVAIYSLLIFAVWLRWFPALGAGPAGEPLTQLWHLALPAFALGLGWVGYVCRLVRASMLEVLTENHIRTARAFGLTERRVIYRYALQIGILPTVTLLGTGMGRLLSGAVFIEIVFNRPGIGKLVLEAVNSRNYPIVLGAVLVTTIIFVLCTLASDLLAAALDPRVREKL